ncbi:adenylosuccinate lyase [Candidatus Kaiserbacteria bacterium]|nr:adenylosuccinate lyase [Candidatus Kaiserbacteria bacterium]
MQHPITALDGRYQKSISELSGILSEFGLMKYRTLVEIEWLLFLKKHDIIPANITFENLKKLKETFGDEHYEKIKEFESTTRHDVKAVEYFLREHTNEAVWPWIHFACTSEDINNIAYTLQLRDAREVVLNTLKKSIIEDLKEKALTWKSAPMLCRTHGQPATPSTMGKEMFVYVHRLQMIADRLEETPLTAKINGATGNYAAHSVAFPEADWGSHSQEFIEGLGLIWNPVTTQIESHDMEAEILDHIAGLASVFSDFCTDVWGYISIGYFGQKVVKGEVGSSTMPHKVNPIDYENARGNMKVARGVARTLSDELPISMWQRDLSDSTLQRNFGLVFGHFLLGLKSLERGLGKIELREDVLKDDLNSNPEVLTEAIQTVLRKNGHADAYEQLKALSRGKRVTLEEIRDFVKTLKIDEVDKENLLKLTPETYTGRSAEIVEKFAR